MQGMRCLEKPRDWDYREDHSQQPVVLSYLHAFSPSEIEKSGFYTESPISTLSRRAPRFSYSDQRKSRARTRNFAAKRYPHLPLTSSAGRSDFFPAGSASSCEVAQGVVWDRKLPEKMQEPHPCERRKSAAANELLAVIGVAQATSRQGLRAFTDWPSRGRRRVRSSEGAACSIRSSFDNHWQ